MSDDFVFSGGTEVITEDDYQNGHPDLEAASSGRLGVGRDKMVYMAVKNQPKEEEDDDDDSDDDDDDEISMFIYALNCKGCCLIVIKRAQKLERAAVTYVLFWGFPSVSSQF